MPNPFYCCGCIHNPKHFVGREQELRRIFTALEIAHTGQLQSISVVGPHRMGRSSLLFHLTQIYEQRLTKPEQYVFLYIDLQRNRYSAQLSQLLHHILVDLRDNLSSSVHPRLCRSLDLALVGQEMTLTEFEKAIQLCQSMAEPPVFPVICLDEFEQLSRYPDKFPDELYDSWRSLINDNQAAFVIASTMPLSELAKAEKLTSTFFGIFSTFLDLNEFAEAEAYELAERGRKCDRPFVDEDIQRALQWGGRHPLRLQQACIAIYNAKSEPMVKWRKVRQAYETQVRHNLGRQPWPARLWRWVLLAVETVGQALLFWKGSEGTDRRVFRLVGSVALLLLLTALILAVVSQPFRTWALLKAGAPTATPTITVTPVP